MPLGDLEVAILDCLPPKSLVSFGACGRRPFLSLRRLAFGAGANGQQHRYGGEGPESEHCEELYRLTAGLPFQRSVISFAGMDLHASAILAGYDGDLSKS